MKEQCESCKHYRVMGWNQDYDNDPCEHMDYVCKRYPQPVHVFYLHWCGEYVPSPTTPTTPEGVQGGETERTEGDK